MNIYVYLIIFESHLQSKLVRKNDWFYFNRNKLPFFGLSSKFGWKKKQQQLVDSELKLKWGWGNEMAVIWGQSFSGLTNVLNSVVNTNYTVIDLGVSILLDERLVSYFQTLQNLKLSCGSDLFQGKEVFSLFEFWDRS